MQYRTYKKGTKWIYLIILF
ncbi:hypothetical protein FE243_06245 [Aliarcobacter thereius]|nr:hypothetical protein EI285_02980 [Aliarcobacter skirrowii]MBP7227392.1 KxYKxGKxW signal peptide domain-containing protein [Aliarcobacter sp.]TLS92605.1 hypothetical protein FE244_06370 [Aliarcobacter thereius]TLT07039.1 hypothetical protein FE243_06245 [Aliarcobacter thereius]